MPGLLLKIKIPGHDDIIEGSFGKTGSAGDVVNFISPLQKTCFKKKNIFS